MIASIFLSRRQSRLDAYGGHTIYFDLHLCLVFTKNTIIDI